MLSRQKYFEISIAAVKKVNSTEDFFSKNFSLTGISNNLKVVVFFIESFHLFQKLSVILWMVCLKGRR